MDYSKITEMIKKINAWPKKVNNYEITSAVLCFYRMLNDANEIPNENLIKVMGTSYGGDYFLRELVDEYKQRGPSNRFNRLFDFIVAASGITLSKEGVEAVDACLPKIDENDDDDEGDDIELDEEDIEHIKRILYSECATYIRITDHEMIKHRVKELIEKL